MEFVVVRNVVEEVERKMLPNFGDHRRSPELVAGRRCRRSRRRENVFGGEKRKEFWIGLRFFEVWYFWRIINL